MLREAAQRATLLVVGVLAVVVAMVAILGVPATAVTGRSSPSADSA